jgi:hypothetical protein
MGDSRDTKAKAFVRVYNSGYTTVAVGQSQRLDALSETGAVLGVPAGPLLGAQLATGIDQGPVLGVAGSFLGAQLATGIDQGPVLGVGSPGRGFGLCMGAQLITEIDRGRVGGPGRAFYGRVACYRNGPGGRGGVRSGHV